MKVAAVIPAYNEESRVGAVIEVLKHCASIDQIVVVSDGSTDKTFEVASSHDCVTAINLSRNLGKGGAMLAGIKQADAEVIVFLDADLLGLTPLHVESLVLPILEGTAEMSIGIFRGGRPRTDWAQKLAPFISGQRAMLRRHLLSIPDLKNVRYGVEVAINRYARLNKLKIEMVPFVGVTHPMKEEKLGFFKGTLSRFKMYVDILRMVISTSNSAIKLRRTLGIAMDDIPPRS